MKYQLINVCKLGKNYIFAHINEEEFEDYYGDHGYENNVPQDRIKAVLAKKAVPFALQEDKPFLDLESWNMSMRKVKKFGHDKNLFYGILYEEKP